MSQARRQRVTRKASPDYMASIHSLIAGFQFGGGLGSSKPQPVAKVRDDLRRFLADDEFWDALIALEKAANRIKAGGLVR
jgi:hypothetical protein